MRTSLNKIQAIEEFLDGTMPSERRLLFEANQLIDKNLSEEIALQHKTYAVVRAYGRAALRDQLTVIHQKLMMDPSRQTFRDLIHSVFQKK